MSDNKPITAMNYTISDLLASLMPLLHSAREAERVLTKNVYPKPDVQDPLHPYNVLKRLRNDIAAMEFLDIPDGDGAMYDSVTKTFFFPPEELSIERCKTAEVRFFLYYESDNRSYNHAVCDHTANPKTIAKFKTKDEATLFLEARRNLYVKEGK